jgi:molybdate transport system substrate-binding protein
MRDINRTSIKIVIPVSILFVLLIIAGCTNISTSTTTVKPEPVNLNVCAGVGLTDVLTEINRLYMQENQNITIVANFAASGTLQKQIEQGAPEDVFISASAKQIDALQKGGLIITDTRRNLLKNKIVLVVPSDSTLGITSFSDLVKHNVGKVAIGDSASVPAGDYGKQALIALGIYDQVAPYLVLCNDVRQVLSYVESGNVDAGIVFATDAAISKTVKIVADAPDEINNKIIYPAAVIKASKNTAAAKAYIAFLLSSEAKAIFEKFGFVVVV